MNYIIRGVGDYEFFREQVAQEELEDRIQEYIEEIPDDITYEGTTLITWERQVIFWFREPEDEKEYLREKLKCAWWCAELGLNAECQDFLDSAIGKLI